VTTSSARTYGPSATGGSLQRFIELTLTLARTDFKLRYFGSILGYVWSLVRPLLFFGVLYLVFTHVFKLGKGVPHYPVYLLTSVVFWNYFLEATGGCVPSLVQREGLLRKMRFPRLVIPLSVSLTALFNLAMNFIAIIVFALANGVYPKLSWLEVIPIVCGYVLLATGIGMLLSALYVRFRDVQPIWDVTGQALFYLSPNIFVVAQFGSLKHLAMANPIALFTTQLGHALIGHVHLAPVYFAKYGPTFPSAGAAAGGYTRLLIPILITLGAFVLGAWVFNREAPVVAENL
jgi:ABC-2 type transport system permease protein